MKKLFLLMTVIATTLVSCQKESPETPPAQSTQANKIAPEPVPAIIQQRELNLGRSSQSNVYAYFYVNAYVAYSITDHTPIGFQYLGGLNAKLIDQSGWTQDWWSGVTYDFTYPEDLSEATYVWTWDTSVCPDYEQGTGKRTMRVLPSQYPFDPSLPFTEDWFPMWN